MSQQEKQAKQQIKELAEKETFFLKDFKEAIDKGLNSWMSYVPGMNQTEQFQELEKRKKVLDCLTPRELNSRGRTIRRKERLRIAEATGQPVEEVKDILHQYVAMGEMHRWLRSRKERGLPVPESAEEIQYAIMQDPGSYDMNAIRRRSKIPTRYQMLKDPRKEDLY